MTILITGAYGGIGEAVCHKLASQGHCLVITGRNPHKLNALRNTLIENYQQEVFAFHADLLNPSEKAALQKYIFKDVKKLSGFIHCAGALSESALMMNKVVDIENDIQLNLLSAIELSQFVSKLMIRQKLGVISLITSIVAQQGSAGQSIYGASKAGVIGFVKSLSKELGPLGVRVNAVSPGFIDTALVAHYPEDKKQEILNKTSLKRLGKTDDVANLLSFLHSENASYITGQVISVDGGLSL